MAGRQAEEARSEGLGLDAAARAALGLDAHEWVGLRERGARFVLLERRRERGEIDHRARGRGSGEPEVPLDRELAITCDVRVFALADVIGWLHGAGKSGLLLFQHDDHAKWVWLHRGEVVFAASNQRIDRLGHSLVRAGVLTFEQLHETERSYRRGERFGKALVERGFVSPRELWSGLQRQVEEIVRSLFSYAAGRIYFWDGDVQPDNVVRLALPTQRLVHEGMRWREDLRRFVKALCDPRVRIEAVAAKRESLGGSERLLFDVLAEESAFPSLCRRARLDPPTAARTLQLLHKTGAVRIHRADEDPDLTQRVRRDDPAERLRAYVHDAVKLLGELAAAIAAVEGPEHLPERFAGAVEEVASRFPGLLAGVRPGPGGVLDPDVLIERALGLAGERSHDVRDAFTSLIDYLEFEVKNHPRIADANGVLRSVAPLRARLLA